MNFEQPEQRKNELGFFCRELNIPQEELEDMKGLADNLKEEIDKIPETEEEDRRRKILDNCENLLEDYFKGRKEKDEIQLLIPLSACQKIISVLRRKIVDCLAEKEDEEKKYDLSLVIDEALANCFTHCKEGSQYGFLSIKNGRGRIKEITTMNFSEEEIPEEILSFLNRPKEEVGESLENFSNNDIDKIINDKEFDPEKELKGLYKKRGLEVIAQIVKKIKYEKINAGEFGFLNKFTFEI